MSERLAIDFVIAGGSTRGLGHVMRSATLAAAARRRGHCVRVFLDGDRASEQAWIEVSGVEPLRTWSDWSPERAGAITCLDHPEPKHEWLDRLERSRTASVVIDDPSAQDRADLTILPQLHHADAQGASHAGPRLLRGPRYALLGAVHLATPRRPLAERDRLLVSLGGADPHHVTPRIAPWLRAVLDELASDSGLVHRDVVLGPAFRDPDARVERALEQTGWQVHRALDPARMAERMAAARLAVMGFGTSLGELAWHGTPHLSVTHHAQDDVWARHLEGLGIGRHLGCALDLDASRVRTRFRAALLDATWQRRSAAAASDALEGGLGGERILDRLEALATRVRRPPRRSPPPAL